MTLDDKGKYITCNIFARQNVFLSSSSLAATTENPSCSTNAYLMLAPSQSDHQFV